MKAKRVAPVQLQSDTDNASDRIAFERYILVGADNDTR